jgi:hypothetical protein
VQNFCPADGNPPDTTTRCFYHEHFEVRQSSQSSDLRVPLFCEVSGNHVLYKGDDYNAGSGCGSDCSSIIILSSATWNGDSIAVFTADASITASNVTISGTASAAFFAGNRVRLLPGFAARRNSYFHAMIKPCEGPPTGCPF